MTPFGVCGFLFNDSHSLLRPRTAWAPVSLWQMPPLPSTGWSLSYLKCCGHHTLEACSEVAEQRLGVPSLLTPDSLGSEHASDLPQASSPGCWSQRMSPHHLPILPPGGHPASWWGAGTGRPGGWKPSKQSCAGPPPACWAWTSTAEEADGSRGLLVPMGRGKGLEGSCSQAGRTHALSRSAQAQEEAAGPGGPWAVLVGL